jgi:hypothetical protein
MPALVVGEPGPSARQNVPLSLIRCEGSDFQLSMDCSAFVRVGINLLVIVNLVSW